MTAYRELIERLGARADLSAFAVRRLRKAEHYDLAWEEGLDEALLREAATALRALEPQSKDKEEGE